MTDILRLSLVSALLFSTCAPVLAAPSDSDMGFGPTMGQFSDVARRGGLGARGFGGANNPTSQEAGLNQSTTGETSGNRNQNLSEANTYWGDNANMDNWEAKNGQSGDIWPAAQAAPARTDFTKGGEALSKNSTLYKPVAGDNLRVQTGLMAPLSVSGRGFEGPQTLGFDWRGGGVTRNAQRVLFGPGLGGAIMGTLMLPQTGTGSVDTEICAPNGKD